MKSIKFVTLCFLAATLSVLPAFGPLSSVWAQSTPLIGGAGGGAGLHIGRVAAVANQVDGQIGRRTPRPLSVNDPLYPRQRITTGPDSRAVVRFRDGSTFDIGPDSEIVLRRFSFNPAASRAEKRIQVVQGAYRYLSGFAVNDSNVQITTPTATMGVRGSALSGFVAEGVPDFVNVARGEVVVRTTGGATSLRPGQAGAAQADRAPADPASMPPAVAAQALMYIQSEIGSDRPALPARTQEQLLADAQANRVPFEQQNAGEMENDAAPAAGGGLLDAPLVEEPGSPGLSGLWDRFRDSVGPSWRSLVIATAFIRAAEAATPAEVAQAVALLTQAAQVGLLNAGGGPVTPAQQAFLNQAAQQFPQAAAILQASNGALSTNNAATSNQGTSDVVSGAAAVADNAGEVAAIVSAAVQAASREGSNVTQAIVSSALSAADKTNTAEAATQIAAAAAAANPAIAAEVATVAIQSLPADQQTAAVTQVSAAAAGAAPASAAAVAAAVVANAGPAAANAVAASVTRAAGSASAASVTAAVIGAAGSQSSPGVASAVARVVGSTGAAEVAAAAAEAAGEGSAARIAAAVVQVTGIESANEVAGAVAAQAAGAGPEVAAAVGRLVGGGEAATLVNAAVAASLGVSPQVMQVAAARVNDERVAEAIDGVAETAAQAIQVADQAEQERAVVDGAITQGQQSAIDNQNQLLNNQDDQGNQDQDGQGQADEQQVDDQEQQNQDNNNDIFDNNNVDDTASPS